MGNINFELNEEQVKKPSTISNGFCSFFTNLIREMKQMSFSLRNFVWQNFISFHFYFKIVYPGYKFSINILFYNWPCKKNYLQELEKAIKIIYYKIGNKRSFSTARKSGNISSHTEKLFSSDTRQSMKRQIATKRLSKIYIARCGCTWLDQSKWPQEWPIGPIKGAEYVKIKDM